MNFGNAAAVVSLTDLITRQEGFGDILAEGSARAAEKFVVAAQDLVVTPIVGALLGELFLRGEDRIAENGGRVLGSTTLGKISLVLLDPAGSLISSLKGWIDWPLRIKAHTEFFYDPVSMYGDASPLAQLSDPVSNYGMRLVFSYE